MPTPFCVVIEDPTTRAVALRWLMLMPALTLASTLLRMSSAAPCIMNTSLEAGYRFTIGQIGSTALRLQPELQLVYTDATTDRHEESNGTIVRSVGDDGLSDRLGLRLQGESRATVGAAVNPYLAGNGYRDGSSNGMAFDEDVLQASVPRNRYEVSAGGRVDFRSGLSGWGGLGVMRGDHGYREATANLGMSYRW